MTMFFNSNFFICVASAPNLTRDEHSLISHVLTAISQNASLRLARNDW